MRAENNFLGGRKGEVGMVLVEEDAEEDLGVATWSFSALRGFLDEALGKLRMAATRLSSSRERGLDGVIIESRLFNEGEVQ